MNFVSMDVAICLFVVMMIMLVTEVIALLTKGKLPQMFLLSVVFLVGYWTILPNDIIERSTLDTVSDITKMLILLHIATMFDLKSLKKEWRTVLITLVAMAGIAAIVFGVCALFYDSNTAIASVPPLMGGLLAAWMMNTAAASAGYADLALLVMIVYIMQAFAGYPITAWLLRKEGTRLCKGYQASEGTIQNRTYQKMDTSVDGNQQKEKRRLINRIPTQMKTPTFYITQLLMLAGIAAGLSMVFKFVDIAIWMIIVGVAAKYLGLLEDAPLDKAKSSGILFVALYVSFMSAFAGASVSDVVSKLIPVVVLILSSTVGILIFSMIAGKLLGYSPYLSGAIGLNCFLGFPINYAITMEAISHVTKNENEAADLKAQLMPKMIISGIVSVTTVSCIVAGVFIKLLS